MSDKKSIQELYPAMWAMAEPILKEMGEAITKAIDEDLLLLAECTCGAFKAGSPGHARYCDKYT